MTPERYQRVGDVFHAVIELPAQQRRDYLVRECVGDPDLLTEVESLLGALESGGSLLDRPIVPALLSDDQEPGPFMIGRRIGPYEIVAHLGEGGMGAVFEARQSNPDRRVALKVMRAGLVSHSAQSRFRQEVQALARLTHPGIAQIHEAGTHADGAGSISYFTMELVPGAGTIIDHARTLQRPQRLALFLQICDAVAHAHQRGVIHRDLKPSNVLVDPEGHVKVLDFGVSKITDETQGAISLHTQTGQLLGTPGYMSPEQAGGDPHAVDVRSDVYSLGVILFELLTGRLPVDISRTTPIDALRLVREQEPTAAGSIDRSLSGDLEVILARALEKDASRRYQSVLALADDLRRHMADEPILARAPTTFEQFRRFTRKNRALVWGSAAVVLALAAGLGVAARQAAIASTARRLAEHLASQGRFREYAAQIQAAAAAIEVNDSNVAILHLDAAPADLRGWEWQYLRSQCDQTVKVIEPDSDLAASVGGLAVSPDGTRLLCCHNDQGLLLHDLASGRALARAVEPGPQSPGRFQFPSFSPDGRRVLVSRQYAGRFEIRNAETLDVERTYDGFAPEALNGVWSPDGRYLALTGGSWSRDDLRQGRTVLLDAATGDTLRVLDTPASRLESLRFLGGGERVVCTSGAAVLVYDLRDGTRQEIAGDPAGDTATPRLAVSPDGTRLAVGYRAATQIFDAATLRPLVLLGAGTYYASVFSPDSRVLYTLADYVVTGWDITSGRRLMRLRFPSGNRCFTLSPDGRRLLVGDDSGRVRILRTDAPPAEMLDLAARQYVAPSPDFSVLAFCAGPQVRAANDQVFLVSPSTGEVRRRVTLGGDWTSGGHLAWSSDGRWLARAEPGQGIAVVDLHSGQEHHVEGTLFSCTPRFLADNTRLLVAREGGADVFTVPDLSLERAIAVGINGRGHVSLAPDGQRLVWFSFDTGERALVRLSDGQGLARWELDTPGETLDTQISIDGEVIAIGCRERTTGDQSRPAVVLRDLSTGRLLARSPQLPADARGVLLDLRHGRLYAALRNSNIVVMGVVTAANDTVPTIFEILTLRSGTSWLQQLFMSPDGTRLLATSAHPSSRALIWDSRPMAERIGASAGSPAD